MKLGSLDREMPLFLAPMAGVTDAAFRRICTLLGADGCVTEMVSAKALYYHNRGTEMLMRRPMDEGVLGLQLFGSDPDILMEMACAREADYDFIDLNMGCPMPKIVKNGDGSALLEQPETAEAVIGKMSRALKKPLTVKMRIGINSETVNGVEMARLAERAGAAALFVHGRTRTQLYSGKADRGEIGRIKAAVSVPVVANGDISDAASALDMIERTRCDGLMIGRAARGNPWIFREIRAALEGRPVPPRPDRREMARVISLHAAWEIEDKGEAVACRELRKHFAWYTSGMTGGAALRKQAAVLSSRADIDAFCKAFLG